MTTLLRYGTPQEAGMSPERVENLRRLGARWVEDGTRPHLVLLVARRGVIVLHEAWGRHGPEPDAPALRTDAIFPLASLSKVFVAICAMTLVEEGLLGLNRPVLEYLSEFQGEGKQDVLVHHLLSHTSGIRDEETDNVVLSLLEQELRPLVEGLAMQPSNNVESTVGQRMLDVIYQSPLSYEPGELMCYSRAAGYTLLAEIVRRVSGEPLVDFSQRRIFGPLGMMDTSFLLAESERDRLVRRPQNARTGDLLDAIIGRVVIGAGSATSTALDMAKLGQALLNGGELGGVRIMSPATVREMTRDQVPGTPAEYLGFRVGEASWGYGWGVTGREKWEGTPSLLSPETFWHTGGSGTALYADPTNELICGYFSSRWGDEVRVHDLFANAAVAAIED